VASTMAARAGRTSSHRRVFSPQSGLTQRRSGGRTARAACSAIVRRATGLIACHTSPATVRRSAVAVAAIDVPDTGTLRGDIRQYLDNACEAIAHPLARHIIPDLLAEATRNPALADALVPTLRTPRRAKAAVLFQRAVKRGELAADSDLEMCMDFLAGPLYWRLAVVHTQTGEDYLDRLTDRILAALTMTA